MSPAIFERGQGLPEVTQVKLQKPWKLLLNTISQDRDMDTFSYLYKDLS